MRAKRKLSVAEIVIYGMMGGVMVAAKEILAWLPNIELVTVLIITYTVVMKKRAIIPTYVFVLLEILLYGFGLWSFTYLYIWLILVVAVLVLDKCGNSLESVIVVAVLAGTYGLMYGLLSAFPTLIVSGPKAAWGYFISGIVYDIGHCVGNVLTTLILYKPLRKLLTDMFNRYFGAM